MIASNAVNLLAAQNTDSQHSINKSSGNRIGVGFGVGGRSIGFTLDLTVSRGRGDADGDDLSYMNAHVNAGNNVSVSGGDTTLKGGVISGNNVAADIGGNLNIESLQDRSTYESKQTSAGFNASLCVPPFCYGASTVGASFSKSNVNGNYLSVLEQSGIKSGDGGFQVAVAGNTDLIGGVLSSSQAVIDQNKNLLTTGSLTSSDLQNKDEHSASGLSLSGSVSAKFGDQTTLPEKLTDEQKEAARADGKPGASGGIGSVSGTQGSVTASGISGGTVVINDQAKQLATGKDADAVLAGVDRSVTTDSSKNAANALTKGWDGQQLQKDVDAQVAITQAFSVQAPKAIAKFADDKIKQLTDQHASLEEIAKWDEGGEYRVALHTVSGALLGGLSGALGSGVVAGSAKQLDDLQTNAEASLIEQGLSPQAAKAAAQAFGELTSLGIGAAVGGESGAATSIATDTNNRQLSVKEIALAKKNATLVQREAKRNGENISVDEAEARIERQILRWVDGSTAQKDGGKTDEVVLSALGMSGKDNSLGMTWDYRNYAKIYGGDYNDPTINQQNVSLYSPLLAQTNVGLTQQQITDRNDGAGAPVAKIGAVALGVATAVEVIPAAGVLANSAFQACKSNIILCINKANIWSSEVAIGDALHTGIGVGVGSLALVPEQKATNAIFDGIGSLKTIPQVQAPLAIGMANTPGVVLRNGLEDHEFLQNTEIAQMIGGVFEGAPSKSFRGIDGWMNGVPVQLKTVEGQSISAIQRNIIKGAINLTNAGYAGDLYIDATKTGISMEKIIDFAKPGTPISNVLNEGSVQRLYIKTSEGWLYMVKGKIATTGGLNGE